MPFIQTPGLHIHYEQAGDGAEAIVLVHGNFASWRWWLPMLEDLPGGYRAYAPDLRGCGDSERPSDGYAIEQLADDLAAFADALSLSRFHLVGHSLGGAVALQFALQHASRLQSITLVAPAPAEGLASPRHHFGLEHLVSADTLARWMPSLALHRPILNRALSRALPALPESIDLGPLVEDALRISPLAVTGFLQALNGWNVQERLNEVGVATLILGGSLDPVVDSAALARTAEGLTRARLVIWPDSGHAPQLEHPRRFRALLQGFLEKPARLAREVPEPYAPPAEPGRLRKLWEGLLQRLRSDGADSPTDRD